MLTKLDYMSYSYPPLSPESMQGQTLVRFWHGLFKQGLPGGTDLSLFESENGRSRSLTKLLNRSGSEKLMEHWFRQFAEVAGEDILLGLTRAWMRVLSAHDYNPDAMNARLSKLLCILPANGELETCENERLFSSLYASVIEESATPLLFRHGLILSLLTVYALYGNRLRDPALDRIRMAMDYGPNELYSLSLSAREGDEARILSGRDCLLCVQPLPREAYFGNQDLLVRAAEVFTAGSGKLLISGLGGIGKTEFTRQLLRTLKSYRLYKRIAFVQYDTDLSSSFARAFAALSEIRTDQRIEKGRDILDKAEEGRTLLLIDNLDNSPSSDSDIGSLCTFGCDIVITSRLNELEGFASLMLNGLDTDTAARLFLSIEPNALKERDTVRKICKLVSGHPLAVTLFARLCKVRFWPAEKLLDRLLQNGIGELSYIRQASSVSISSILTDTFDLSRLSHEQIKLLRLMSLLPSEYWRPDHLSDYAQDICRDVDALTDLCCMLGDLGWLMLSEDGFAIHPLIAQIIRLQKFGTREFPTMWQRLSKAAQAYSETDMDKLITVIMNLPVLDIDNIRSIVLLAQRVGFVPFVRLPEKIYDLISDYLKTKPHELSDEADFRAALCMRDWVILNDIDAFRRHLKELVSDLQLIGSISDKCYAYSLLETGGALSDSGLNQLISAALEALKPDEDDLNTLASYYITLGEHQRKALREPQKAICTLNAAEALLQKLSETETRRCANLFYRKACCMLDLSQDAGAAALLERYIDLMRRLGCDDSSVNMMTAHNTYALALTFVGDYQKALDEYRFLDRLYKTQKRDQNSAYAVLQNNMAMLLYKMSMYKQAEICIQKALRIDKKHGELTRNLCQHQRNAALILTRLSKHREAMSLATEAVRLHEQAFGENAFLTLYAKAVYALTLAHNGQSDTALELVDVALSALIKELGKEHRFTQTALECREEILRLKN